MGIVVKESAHLTGTGHLELHDLAHTVVGVLYSLLFLFPQSDAVVRLMGNTDQHTLQTAPCVVEVRNAVGRKILDSSSPFVILCHQFLETKERRRIHNANDAIHMHHIASWNVIAVLAKNRQLPN